MSKFLITVLIFLLVAAAGGYFAVSQGYLSAPTPEPLPQAPVDYHILSGQGGVPLEDALRGGLVSDEFAYLAGLEPISVSRGVEQNSDLHISGHQYDLGYMFTSQPAQTQSLEFNLLGNWRELHFGFGFQDSEASDPHNKLAIKFTVQVDGETLFGPERLTPVDKPVFRRLDVAGSNRVTFVVDRIGNGNHFAPVLADPFVIK